MQQQRARSSRSSNSNIGIIIVSSLARSSIIVNVDIIIVFYLARSSSSSSIYFGITIVSHIARSSSINVGFIVENYLARAAASASTSASSSSAASTSTSTLLAEAPTGGGSPDRLPGNDYQAPPSTSNGPAQRQDRSRSTFGAPGEEPARTGQRE